MTDIESKVIDCVAEAYAVDASTLTLDTDIRNDLSNVSMKLLVLISTIEESLDVELTMGEVSQLRTIGDFAKKVEELSA